MLKNTFGGVYAMIDEIFKKIEDEIDNLDKHEREQLLRLLIRRYFSEYFPLKSEWWDEKDNIYDSDLHGDSDTQR